MVIIKNEWYGKNVRIKNVCDKIFYGGVVEITRKENNSETNRDSLSIYDGKNYIFFSDNEIKEIEILKD